MKGGGIERGMTCREGLPYAAFKQGLPAVWTTASTWGGCSIHCTTHRPEDLKFKIKCKSITPAPTTSLVKSDNRDSTGGCKIHIVIDAIMVLLNQNIYADISAELFCTLSKYIFHFNDLDV